MKEYLRGILVSVVIMLTFLSMATGASAMSLQVHGGGATGDLGEGQNIGADLSFYEGKSIDFFVGYDYISVGFDSGPYATNPITQFATKTNIVSLGLRYKFQTSSSWKPYLSLGVALINTKFTFQPGGSSFFEDPQNGATIGPRFGLGIDVGISESWSLGLDGTAYYGVQQYTAVPTSQGQLGAFGPAKVSDDGYVILYNLGLRYHF